MTWFFGDQVGDGEREDTAARTWEVDGCGEGEEGRKPAKTFFPYLNPPTNRSDPCYFQSRRSDDLYKHARN